MYQNRKSQSNRRNNKRGFKGHYNRRRQSSFNPTALVRLSKQQTPELQKEQVKEVIQNSFADFNLVDSLACNISDKGYETPTPIQDRIIKHILKECQY